MHAWNWAVFHPNTGVPVGAWLWKIPILIHGCFCWPGAGVVPFWYVLILKTIHQYSPYQWIKPSNPFNMTSVHFGPMILRPHSFSQRPTWWGTWKPPTTTNPFPQRTCCLEVRLWLYRAPGEILGPESPNMHFISFYIHDVWYLMICGIINHNPSHQLSIIINILMIFDTSCLVFWPMVGSRCGLCRSGHLGRWQWHLGSTFRSRSLGDGHGALLLVFFFFFGAGGEGRHLDSQLVWWFFSIKSRNSMIFFRYALLVSSASWNIPVFKEVYSWEIRDQDPNRPCCQPWGALLLQEIAQGILIWYSVICVKHVYVR